MTLVDKVKKVNENIELSSNKQLGEEAGKAPEKHQAIETDHPEVAVAEFVKKDGKLLQQAAAQDAQDSGVYEKAAKKAGVKKEDLVYTAPTQAAAQSIVCEDKHPDVKGAGQKETEGESAKLLNKSGDWPKSVAHMHIEGDLKDPQECNRQVKLHMKHAGMADNMTTRMWHHQQAKEIHEHMTGKKPFQPVRYNISKSMSLCKSLKLNPELTSTEPTHTHDGVKVKVFSHHKAFDGEGKAVRTAEIMEGEHKGKWTTVHEHKLKPLNKAHVGFKKLEHKIEGEGYSKEKAGAITAAIGRKKYGKEGMAEKAKAGLNKSDKDPKFESCVQDVKKKQGTDKVNPWAVCHASLKKSREFWNKVEKTDGMPMYKSVDIDELRARAKHAVKRRRIRSHSKETQQSGAK